MYKLFNFYVFFLIAGFPLFSFIPIPGATIIFRGLLFLFGITLLLLVILNKKKYINKKILYLIIFLLIYLMKLVFDFTYTNLPFGREKYEILLLYFSNILIPLFVFLFYPIHCLNIKKLVFSVLISLFIVCVLAILNGVIFGYSYRLSGNQILNPITLGHYAVSAILISTHYIFFDKGKNNFYFIFVNAICFLCLMLAESRGPLLSLLIIYVIIFYYKNNSYLAKYISLIFVFISVFILYSLLSTYYGDILVRYYVNLDENDGEARIFLWKYAIEQFLNNPFIGTSTTTSYGYVHNMFLEILMSLGILGGIFYLFFTYSLFNKFISMIKNQDIRIIFGSLFLQYSIASFFSGTVYSNDLIWVFSGLFIISLNSNERLY